jgi:ribosomal protein S18 acetylase RimI-like enzyme
MRTRQRSRVPLQSPAIRLERREDARIVDQLRVSLSILIRRCRRGDLRELEWWGLYSLDREVIESTFEAQSRGESIMLVAEANEVPVGQAWIDLTRLALDATGVIWAVRVFPCLQNQGLGTRLIEVCEELLHDRGFRRCELSVERDNARALRLYERLGYRKIPTRPGTEGEITSDPIPVCVPATQFLMRKQLAGSAGRRAAARAGSSRQSGRAPA